MKKTVFLTKFYTILLFIVKQQYTRQQTTTNDYCRQQTFNQRLFLDKLRYFAASNL